MWIRHKNKIIQYRKFQKKCRKLLIKHLVTTLWHFVCWLFDAMCKLLYLSPFVLYKYQTNPCQYKAPVALSLPNTSIIVSYPFWIANGKQYLRPTLSTFLSFNSHHRLEGDLIDNYSSECLFCIFYLHINAYLHMHTCTFHRWAAKKGLRVLLLPTKF